MGKLLHVRRALSPIIATVILIAIVLAGGLLTFAVYNNFFMVESQKTQVDFEVLELYKNSYEPKIAFVATLKNTGNKPIILLTVKLHNESDYTIPTVTSSKPLDPGKSVSILLTDSTTPAIHADWYIVGNFYTVQIIKAVASDGGSFSHITTVMCKGTGCGGTPTGPSSGGNLTGTTPTWGEGQSLLVFGQEGLDDSALGNVVTISASPAKSYTYDNVPVIMVVKRGAVVRYEYSSIIQRSVPNSRYRLEEVDGPASPVNVTAPVLIIIGKYVRQWPITFYERGLWNIKGAISDKIVLKIGGLGVKYSQMPYTYWADEGTISFSYVSPFGEWSQNETLYWSELYDGAWTAWAGGDQHTFEHCGLIGGRYSLNVKKPENFTHTYIMYISTSGWSHTVYSDPEGLSNYHHISGLRVKLQLSKPYYLASSVANFKADLPGSTDATVAFYHGFGDTLMVDGSYTIPANEPITTNWGAMVKSPRTGDRSTYVIWALIGSGDFATTWAYTIGYQNGVKFYGVPSNVDGHPVDGYDQLCERALTITSSSGGTTDPAPGSYWYSDKAEVSAIPDSGYVLDKWILDGSEVAPSNKIVMTMNAIHTLQAVFVKASSVSTSTLTLTSTGGTITPQPDKYIMKTGARFTATALQTSGYVFKKWVLDGVDNGADDTIAVTVDRDHTLQAVFEPLLQLTIQTTFGGTTCPSPGTYFYEKGRYVKVAAAPGSWDIKFHWELNGVNVGSDNPIKVTINQSCTLKAVFDAVRLTIDASAGGSTNPGLGTYAIATGKNVTIKAFSDPGFKFVCWRVDGVDDGSNTTLTITMNMNHTVYAYFAKALTLSIITTEGGTTSPEPGTYACLRSDKLSITAIPSPGYAFEEWIYDEYYPDGSNYPDTFTDNPLTLTMYENCTLQPIFTLVGNVENCDIESPHPYPNNYDNTWIITRAGATQIKVHFQYIEVECWYDRVYVMNATGYEVQRYSDFYTDIWSPWVVGDTLKVRLKSDASVNYDGFVIDQIAWTNAPPPEFNFSISVSPESVVTLREKPATIGVSVSLTTSIQDEVSLSVSGLPAGASAQFKPSKEMPPFVSTLSIYTSESTPIGVYNITVTATSENIRKNSFFLLDVRESSKVTFKAMFQYHGSCRNATGRDAWILQVDDDWYLVQQLPVTYYWYVGSTHTFAWYDLALDETPDFSSPAGSVDTMYNWTRTEGLSTEREGTITAAPGGGEVVAYYSRRIYVNINLFPGSYESYLGSNVGTNSTPSTGWYLEGTTFTAISSTDECIPGYWVVGGQTVQGDSSTVWDAGNIEHFFKIKLTICVVDTNNNGLEGVNINITTGGQTLRLCSNDAGYIIVYLPTSSWNGPPYWIASFTGNAPASAVVPGVTYNFMRWQSGGGALKYGTTSITESITNIDDINSVFWYVVYQKP